MEDFMKKTLSALIALSLALLLTSCKTTSVSSSKIKGGNKAKAGSRTYTVVDYQGASLGKTVPRWVELIYEGQYSRAILQKEMPGLEGQKVFVVQGRGDNLDFVKSWVTLVDVETEVSGAMGRVTVKVVTSKMEASASSEGKVVNPSEVSKQLEDFRMAVQDVRISGLERVAEYWVEIQVSEKKKVIDDYYEYFSVWVVDQKSFNKQLETSLKNIDKTTPQTQELAELVRAKLADEISVSSNDEEVLENADDYIVYAE